MKPLSREFMARVEWALFYANATTAFSKETLESFLKTGNPLVSFILKQQLAGEKLGFTAESVLEEYSKLAQQPQKGRKV